MPDDNPDDNIALLLRVVGGDPDATAEAIVLAPSSTSPALLVAAGLLTRDSSLLLRAATSIPACWHAHRQGAVV